MTAVTEGVSVVQGGNALEKLSGADDNQLRAGARLWVRFQHTF